MNIDTSKIPPVYGYSMHGKHRVPIDVVQWLEAELQDAERYQAKFNYEAAKAEHDDYELEIQRHEQDGWVYALSHVLRYAKGEINE